MAKRKTKDIVDRTKLPLPEPKFKGVIGKTCVDSKADWPAVPKPPEGAPNVVVILLDDVGFGQVSTFGGPVPTPELDRLAAKGLRYNRFHTTAICGPSRAALITGRNHHNCGVGFLAEWATGFPSYNNMIPKSCATIGAVLKGNGYSTSWFGKNHNTPDWESSVAGPFTAGRPAWVSTIFTASSAARPTSITRSYSRTPSLWSPPSRPKRATTSWPI
jgi:arylsulfatase